MTHRNQPLRGDIPDLEKTELTPQEEQVFSEMIEEILPGSAEQTQQFLDGHRQEAQGQ